MAAKIPTRRAKKALKPLDYRAAYRALVKAALSYPEASEDHPWGETAMKVRGKIFLFLRRDPDGLFLTVKLPRSREFALAYKFTEPAAYGLGKSGWVSAEFGPKAKVPMDLLLFWLNESYCAVAPKKLAATFLPPSPVSSTE